VPRDGVAVAAPVVDLEGLHPQRTARPKPMASIVEVHHR
jgi:hypothetical protein